VDSTPTTSNPATNAAHGARPWARRRPVACAGDRSRSQLAARATEHIL
jgi:hypothetical protein